MFHSRRNNNSVDRIISPRVIFYILLAGASMLGPSIAVHAEEGQAAMASQAEDTSSTEKSEACSGSSEETGHFADITDVQGSTAGDTTAEQFMDESAEQGLTAEDIPSRTDETEERASDQEEAESDIGNEDTEQSEIAANPATSEKLTGTQADISMVSGETDLSATETNEAQTVSDTAENIGNRESDHKNTALTTSEPEAPAENSDISQQACSIGGSGDNTSDAGQSDSEDSSPDNSETEDSDGGEMAAALDAEDEFSAENAGEQENGENVSLLNQLSAQNSGNNTDSSTTAGYVTPQDFGARGDNVSDDTDAINQAIGSLSAEHDTLYIPDGAYRVNTIRKINLRSNIKVVLESDARLIAIPNGESGYCILSLQGLNNVRISGGQLYGDRYNHQGTEGEWGYGIGVFDSSNVVIDGVKVYDCWGDGIYLGSDHDWTSDAGCNSITIQNCELAGNRRNDLSIVSADNVTVQNCIFRDANGTDPQFGVDIETNNDNNPNEHIYFDNCMFYGNAKGSMLINSAANDVQISNSVLNGTFINYAGTNVVLSNTTVNGEADCRRGVVLKNHSVINDHGTTDDVAVVDYSAANATSLYSYRQDSSNRIAAWFGTDTKSPSGSYIGMVRTGWGSHDAGITLRLAELSGGRLGKMIPGRTYRIQYTVMGTGSWGYLSNQTGWYPILPQSDAYSTGMVTYLAGDTGDGTLSFYATDLNDGMWLRIANIQVLDEDYSGMSQQSDGTWVYSENGNVDTRYTGMACNENGWWYIKNGTLDWTYTGMASNENGWWYYRNGRIDWSYTGEGTNEAGVWYYQNGRIAWGLTGMAFTGAEWRYVRDGRVVTDYTGMACNENGWWYFKNGALDWTYTGMAENENGWWYYRNGRIDWSYTGEGTNEAGVWYYQNGRIAWELTGMAYTGTEWLYVRNGKVVTDYTGMAWNENGWWYFKNGALDWTYTGMASNENGWWYYRNGRIDWTYSEQLRNHRT